MATPPPTETPAPLSEDSILPEILRWKATLSDKTWTAEQCEIVATQLEQYAATICALRARNEALASAYRESAKRNSYSYTAARLVEAESTIARHVAALQEIGKGVEADQATIARLTAERDNALADADNDRSLAASRQREVARLSEELAQADAFVALNCDHHGQVWTRQVMGIAEREDMITRHRARHDIEEREG